MHSLRLIPLVFLFLIGMAHLAQAQVSISGRVIADDQGPAAGAFVRLMMPDSMTMKSFTAADGEGKWTLRNVATGDYLLNVKYLGAKELFLPIQVDQEPITGLDLQLEPDAQLLPGVEVKGDAIGVTMAGDTIKFNINYFSSGDEISLGDVLNQLPGVEVDEDGTVSYGGNEVDKLLIHGRDVLDDKRKIATESIRANQLEGVNVIQDYRDPKDIDKTRSEKTALDVRLKKDALGAWSGDVKAYGGYQDAFEANATAFTVDENLAATFFAKANNVGEQVISRRDYFKLKGFRILRNMQNPASAIGDALSSFAVSEQTTSNLDATLAGSVDYDINELTTIKGNFIFAQIKRTEQESFTRRFYNDAGIWTGDQLTEQTHPILSGYSILEKKFNDQFTSAIGVNVNYESYDHTNNTLGLYLSDDYNNLVDRTSHLLSISPELRLQYYPGAKWRFTLESALSYDKSDQAEDFLDISPILNFGILNSDSMYIFAQAKDIYQNTVSNFLDVQYDLVGALYAGVEFNANNAWLDKSYMALSDVPDFSGEVDSYQDQRSYKFKLVLDTTKWLVRLGLTAMDDRLHLNGQKEELPIRLTPNMTIRYSFNRMHFLLVGFNESASVSDMDYGQPTDEIQSARSFMSYDIDWWTRTRSRNFTTSYFNLQPGSGRMIHFMANYAIQDNPIGSNTITTPDYTKIALIRLPRQSIFTAQASFRDQIADWPIRIRLRYNVNDINGNTAVNGVINKNHRFSQGINVGLSSKWKKTINYRANYRISHSKQTTEFQPNPTTFITHEPSVELSYRKNQFLWKNELGYRISTGDRLSASYWDLRWDLSYGLKKLPYRLYLKGRNLLNINTVEQVSVNFSNEYVEEQIYRTFPGYLLLGAAWEFGSGSGDSKRGPGQGGGPMIIH